MECGSQTIKWDNLEIKYQFQGGMVMVFLIHKAKNDYSAED